MNNKMPEMPEAVGYVGSDMTGRIGVVLPAGTFLYTADQMRAMYLAGIEAAKACVPRSRAAFRGPGSVEGWNACRDQTLANLTALEQEAKK